MMHLAKSFLIISLLFICIHSRSQQTQKGNPVIAGWYADPDAGIFNTQCWIYPTYSAPYEQQVFLDVFSSPDMQTWTKHHHILDTSLVKWARKAIWAPAIAEKNGKYFLFFSANDVHEGEIGGIGVAIANNPAGPFKDLLGKPLINEIKNGAQPIDQFVFRDKDGTYYMIYGGWQHCNIVKLKNDFTGLLPFADGELYKEITPKSYVEGPMMFMRNGKYYFMWSEGGWTGPDYRVAYAIGDSPFGPFERIGTVLQQDSAIATGAGHHTVIKIPGRDEWFIIYHRRPLGETDANHRVVCIDRIYFDEKGFINPIKITNESVGKVRLK